MPARDILSDTLYLYRSCKTYRDSGNIQWLLKNHAPFAGRGKAFKTAFARGDRFRFEADDAKDRRIIWFNGDKVILWNRGDFQFIRPQKRASYGAASVLQVIHFLLMPELFADKPNLIHVDNAKRLDDSTLADKKCFRVEMRSTAVPLPLTVWIDQESKAIRRIDEGNREGGQVTTIDPIFNEPIADNLLEFAPPAR
jgi:hypothetical protein